MSTDDGIRATSTADDVQTSTVAVVAFLGAILTFAAILLLTVVYYRIEARQEYVKNVSQPYLEVENLVAGQQAKLVEYRWVDRERQIVAVPIDRAMDLVVKELSGRAAGRTPQVQGLAAPPRNASNEPPPEASNETD